MTNIKEMLPPTTHKQFPCLLSKNMGKLTLKMTLSIEEFFSMSVVYNREFIEEANLSVDQEAQRLEKSNHTKLLSQYIVAGLVQQRLSEMEEQGEEISKEIHELRDKIGMSTYCAMQPITCNLRDVSKHGDGLHLTAAEIEGGFGADHKIGLVSFKKTQSLAVVDGQHRRVAFGRVLEWLHQVDRSNGYPKFGLFNPQGDTDTSYLSIGIKIFWRDVLNEAMASSYVSIECHLGLTVDEERQLFSDLNFKGLKVSKAQNLDYDTSEPLNALMHDFIDQKVFKFTPRTTDESDWQSDERGILRKDLNTITSFLLFGKGSSKGVLPIEIREKRKFAEKFWNIIQGHSPLLGSYPKKKTILAQSVVLKGIAKLAHTFAHGKLTTRNLEHLKKLYQSIDDGSLDFSHTNRVWRSLMMDPATRAKKFPGLNKYVHVPEGTNLDAGVYDSENVWVRYGSKHNDIYMRIGDLIRFQLGLPPRPEVTKSIAKERSSKAKKEV